MKIFEKILFFILISLLINCSSRINEKKQMLFKNIIRDLYIADRKIKLSIPIDSQDLASDYVVKKIIEKHNSSKEEFSKILDFYYKNPTEFAKVLEAMEKEYLEISPEHKIEEKGRINK